MTCYSSSQLVSFLQNINKHISLKWKINTKIVFLQEAQFLAVWGPVSSSFQKIHFGNKPSYKKLKVSEGQIFQETSD